MALLWHFSDSQQLKISACIIFFLNVDFEAKTRIRSYKKMPRNNASCSELTEVMSRVVDAAAPFNLRAAKPRKLKCYIYKMDSFFFFSFLTN